jgi:hypothetical protein
MRIPRMNILVFVVGLMTGSSWAVAEETSHDTSFTCRTLCPGMACPQSCQPARSEGPQQGSYPAAPETTERSEGPHEGAYDSDSAEDSGQEATRDK